MPLLFTGVFVDQQLDLPFTADANALQFVSNVSLSYILMQFDLSIKRSPIPIPQDAPDTDVAKATELRMLGAYLGEQLSLPGIQ